MKIALIPTAATARVAFVLVLSVVLAPAARADVAAVPPNGYKNESALGYVMTSGNTKTTSLNVTQLGTYTFEAENAFTLRAGYLKARQNEETSAENWNVSLRYERSLSPRFSIFLGQGVMGDRFQDIRQRHNSDLGGKYYFFREDTITWFGEGGYRFTRENTYTAGHKNLHYVRTYSEVEKKFNPSVSAKYWAEYLPNLTNGTDWLLNTELSLNAMLNDYFSVKTGYLVKFDNLPAAPGLKKTDTVLTTALVAKF